MARAILKLALLAAITVCAGCAGQPAPAAKEPSTPCEATGPAVTLSAGDRLNADSSGAARPVQVRLYLLKNDARLKNAKFDEVWQGDTAIFQTNLVKVQEVTLYPNETKVVELDPNADAHALAAVAIFREPQGKTWFVTYELEPPPKASPCPTNRARISVWLDRMRNRRRAWPRTNR